MVKMTPAVQVWLCNPHSGNGRPSNNHLNAGLIMMMRKEMSARVIGCYCTGTKYMQERLVVGGERCVSSKYPTNPGRLRPLSVWRAHA